ncbi:MAG: hypothetical protein PHE32_04000 [Candidatus Shapirobacteria bacterium]|nr:hypothetical protein [Candidatus Shapirobacteria bacterium]
MAENQCLYTNVQLGFGIGKTQTIASIGCFLTSLQNGLKRKGYALRFPTPIQYNEFCKQKNTFSDRILLSPEKIVSTQPEYFLEGKREVWNDFYVKQYLDDPTYILIGEVSGKGIGGSGQHFVEIKKVDVRGDGRITMAYIDDPWGGKEDMKVTQRYGKFGNILSLRVFKIVKAPVEEKTTITAIVNTNIRTAPRTNAPKASNTGTKVDGILGKGDKIKNATLVKGEEVNGVNGWWQSPKGRFVWSGGTDKERKI